MPNPNSEIQTYKRIQITTIFKGKTRKINQSTSNSITLLIMIIWGNEIRVLISSLISKSTHIRNISFQEKTRPVIMRLLCKMLQNKITLYVMFNNLSMISVLLRSTVLSVVDISLVLSSAFAAPLLESLGNGLNVTTL